MIKAKFSTSGDISEQNIIAVGEGEVEQLSRILEEDYSELFSGKEKLVQRAAHQGSQYWIIGLGKNTNPENIKSLGEYFSKKIGYDLKYLSTTILLPENFNEEQAELFLIGFLSGTYQIDETSKETHFLYDGTTSISMPMLKKESWSKALHLAEGRTLARRWLDRGQNQKTAPILSAFLVDWAQEIGVELNILNREQCEDQGLSAYLAVNQGSAHDASFAILQYTPPNPLLDLGLVGKCITFDTGGISIKSSTNLHYMKSDMGGATAVLGAVHSIVKQKLPVNIVAAIPITDNAVDRTAYVPSDVISSHAGKRIEIIDTDAEGRLTLADALSYLVKEYNPEVLIDLATLTGSAVRTLGFSAAALFSENEVLQNQLRAAGKSTGEKLWPLPMWSEYRSNLDSDVADIKNYSGRPLSGASDAAVFLKDFTHDHPSWAHLDIAGVAFGQSHFGKDKSATAYGVHLLYRLVEVLLDEKVAE